MAQRIRTVTLLIASCVALAVVGCHPASSLPTVQVSIASPSGRELGVFSVEVAATNEERSKGLMFRRELGARQGMLFLFPQARRLSFWMKNTLIPLDMVFVSSDWRVVGVVADAVPLTEDPRTVEEPSQYVLEFAGGTAAKEGIVPGAVITVRGALPPAR